MTKTCRKS